MGGVNLVVGFRPELWREVSGGQLPSGLAGFDEDITGPDGFVMPATQHDAVLWVSGSAYDVVFDVSRAAIAALAELATVAEETSSWPYQHARDLTTDNFQGFACPAFGQRFADTDDRMQAEVQRAAHLGGDHQIDFTVPRAPLRVADDDPAATNLHQHFACDLARVSARCMLAQILPTNRNTIRDPGDHLRDKNKWRQTAHKIYKTPSSITFVKLKRH